MELNGALSRRSNIAQASALTGQKRLGIDESGDASHGSELLGSICDVMISLGCRNKVTGWAVGRLMQAVPG